MEENKEKMQEMQILQQNLQNTLHQRQAFQMELNETKSAIEEIKKSDDEVFKIIGGLMIKTGKNNAEKELAEKEKFLEMRIKTIEKQENFLRDKIKNLEIEPK